MVKRSRSIEVKYGRRSIVHIDMSNKHILFPSNRHHLFHQYEGITKELILKVLSNNTDFRKSSTRHRRTQASANLYVTELIQRFPPIRITVTFLLKPDNVVLVTNAFLGSINSKSTFEKDWNRYWKK